MNILKSFRISSLAHCISDIYNYNSMKQSLLFILTASILVSSVISIAEIQYTDAATNLHSSKSNVYRDISVQASGDDSQASFKQSNTNKETASENNCNGAECSISVSYNTE
jgi:uncharacterized membrane protein